MKIAIITKLQSIVGPMDTTQLNQITGRVEEKNQKVIENQQMIAEQFKQQPEGHEKLQIVNDESSQYSSSSSASKGSKKGGMSGSSKALGGTLLVAGAGLMATNNMSAEEQLSENTGNRADDTQATQTQNPDTSTGPLE